MERLRLLSAKDLVQQGFGSRTTIWRRIRAGEFPAPIKIGGAVRWRESDVYDWLDSLAPQEPKIAEGREDNVDSTQR